MRGLSAIAPLRAASASAPAGPPTSNDDVRAPCSPTALRVVKNALTPRAPAMRDEPVEPGRGNPCGDVVRRRRCELRRRAHRAAGCAHCAELLDQRREVGGRRRFPRHRLSRVTGWTSASRVACSACRGKAGTPAARPGPYAGSPTSGWPMAATCTRIWCVRPVSSVQRNSVAMPKRSTTSTCVRAGLPFATTAIVVRWSDGGRSARRRSSRARRRRARRRDTRASPCVPRAGGRDRCALRASSRRPSGRSYPCRADARCPRAAIRAIGGW